MLNGKGMDQILMDRMPDMEEVIRRIKASIAKERRKSYLQENVNFERGQDPKDVMGIGVKPFDWDEIYDAWEGSDAQRLFDPDGWGDKPHFDSFMEGIVDEEGLTGDEVDAAYDAPYKIALSGIIDHPMSGYGGSYNQAHLDLVAEKLPNEKIHVTGTKIMEHGSIEKDEDGDYAGERYGGSMGKEEQIDDTFDSVKELIDALEEYPQ
jgi:hypothetical protein